MTDYFDRDVPTDIRKLSGRLGNTVTYDSAAVGFPQISLKKGETVRRAIDALAVHSVCNIHGCGWPG